MHKPPDRLRRVPPGPIPTRALLLLALAALAACGPDAGAPTAPETTATAASPMTSGQGLVIVDPPAPYLSPGRLGDVQDRNYFHDFGHVPFGRVVERVFHLENRAGRAVTIHDLLPSCGCTVPEVLARTRSGEVLRGERHGDGPLLVVPEGAALEVLVRIDTRRVPEPNRDKLAQVRMRSDAPDPYLTFELHVRAELPLQADPAAIELFQVPTTTGASGSTEIRAVAAGASVSGVAEVEGPLAARLAERRVLDQPVWTLEVDVQPGLPLGALRGMVSLATVDPRGDAGPPLEVAVVGRIVADVVLDPPALHLGPPGADGTSRAEASLEALIPGARVRVLAIELVGPGTEGLSIAAEPIDVDASGRAARWRVTLTAPAGAASASVSGRVRIALDDPSVPELSVPFTSARR